MANFEMEPPLDPPEVSMEIHSCDRCGESFETEDMNDEYCEDCLVDIAREESDGDDYDSGL